MCRVNRALYAIAGAVTVVLVVFAGGYGYHRDELYFLEAGRHLAWSYADQGPVTPLIARAMDTIAPDSLTVLRLPSAVAAGLTVFLTGQLARELGGTVLMDAFDVLDVGRMAVIRDPIGAVVALWEPRRHIGAGVVGEPGTTCWNELVTDDLESAGTFYTALLEWQCESHPTAASTYTYCRRGASVAGGMRPIDAIDGPVRSHWLLYFAVEDCDAAAAKAESLGGRVVIAPADAPEVGRFAVLQDPQEAAFAVVKLLPA